MRLDGLPVVGDHARRVALERLPAGDRARLLAKKAGHPLGGQDMILAQLHEQRSDAGGAFEVCARHTASASPPVDTMRPSVMMA